jgi:hypothetical protein
MPASSSGQRVEQVTGGSMARMTEAAAANRHRFEIDEDEELWKGN